MAHAIACYAMCHGMPWHIPWPAMVDAMACRGICHVICIDICQSMALAWGDRLPRFSDCFPTTVLERTREHSFRTCMSIAPPKGIDGLPVLRFQGDGMFCQMTSVAREVQVCTEAFLHKNKRNKNVLLCLAVCTQDKAHAAAVASRNSVIKSMICHYV